MPISKDFIVSSAYPKLDVPKTFFGEYLYERLTALPQDLVVEIQYDTGEKQTIGQIVQHGRRVASYLLRQGIKHEERVAIFMDNVLEYSPIAAGIAFAGATFTYLRSDMLTNLEYRHRVGIPKLVFVSGLTTAQNLLKAGYTGVILVDKIPQNDIPTEMSSYYYDCLQDDGTLFDSMAPMSGNPANRVQLVTFTSGTTGLAKPVMISHQTIVNIFLLNDFKEYRIFTKLNNRCIIPAQFSVNHMGAYLFRVLFFGIQPLNILINPDDPVEACIKAIEKYKCNSLISLPVMIAALISHPARSQHDISSLKHLLLTGGTVRKQTKMEWKKNLNLETIYFRLVFSEAGGTVMSSTSDSDESVGRLLPNMEAKVVDIKSGKNLGPNQVGELCVRGINRFLGYYNMPEKTREDIDSEGFFHNGDLVYYDEQENFYYFDRLKEVIQHREGLISATSLESALLSKCPNVSEACVIAVPESKSSSHQVPRAVILPTSAKVNINKLVNDAQNCAKTIHPKGFEGGVDVRMDVPRTVTGKHRKPALIEDYLNTLK